MHLFEDHLTSSYIHTNPNTKIRLILATSKAQILQRRLNALKNEHKILENISKHSNFSRNESRPESLHKRSFQKRGLNCNTTEAPSKSNQPKNSDNLARLYKTQADPSHQNISENKHLIESEKCLPSYKNSESENISESDKAYRDHIMEYGNHQKILVQAGSSGSEPEILKQNGENQQFSRGSKDFVHSLSFKNFHGQDKTSSSQFRKSGEDSQLLGWTEKEKHNVIIEGNQISGGADLKFQRQKIAIPNSYRTTLDVNLCMTDMGKNGAMNENQHISSLKRMKAESDLQSKRLINMGKFDENLVYRQEENSQSAKLGYAIQNDQKTENSHQILNNEPQEQRRPGNSGNSQWERAYEGRRLKPQYKAPNNNPGQISRTKKEQNVSAKEQRHENSKRQGFTAEEVSSLMQLKFLKKKGGSSKAKFF